MTGHGRAATRRVWHMSMRRTAKPSGRLPISPALAGPCRSMGYGGYRTLAEKSGVTLAFCWAHLWTPPTLQGLYARLRQCLRLQSSIRPLRCGAPCTTGLDGISANRHPITLRELEARCAQRVHPVPVRPVLPSPALLILTSASAPSRADQNDGKDHAASRVSAPYVPPYRSNAHTTRAVLFAIATTATLAGRRSLNLASQIQVRPRQRMSERLP